MSTTNSPNLEQTAQFDEINNDKNSNEKQVLLNVDTSKPEKDDKLTNEALRIPFTSKTLFYLFMGLLCVLSFCMITVLTDIAHFLVGHWIWLTISLIGIFIVVLLLFFAKGLCRTTPINWIISIIFITLMAYSTTYICEDLWEFNAGKWLMACIFMMTISVGILWLFVKWTKYDISLKVGLLFSLGFGLGLFFLIILIDGNAFLTAGLLGAAMGIFIYYIIWDLDKITLEGRYDLKSDDHLLAATHLYVDFFVLPYLIFALIKACHKE